MSEEINQSYEFGPFRIVPAERLLLRDGRTVALPGKAFDTLLVFVRHSGRILRKEELIDLIWPGAFVEESNLSHYVSLLRKALDDGCGESYIQTVRGHGFRFTAPVHDSSALPSSVFLRRHTHVVVKEALVEKQTTIIRSNKTRTLNRLVLSGGVILLLAGTIGYFGFARRGPSNNIGAAPVTSVAGGQSVNPAAREAYVAALAHWNRRAPQDIREAVELFHEAIRLDPNYAAAYAGLAGAYLVGGQPTDGTEDTEELFRKAISLDDQLPDAHASLAYYLSAVKWNWAEAEREFRRAIELDQNYATAHHWYAYHLASLGHLNEALAEIVRARELAPDSLIIKTDVGQILFFLQRYSGAIAQYQRVLEKDPNFAIAHLRLGEAYAQVDKFAEALDEIGKAQALGIGVQQSLAYLYAVSGHRAPARRAAHAVEEELRKGERHDRVSLALAYAVLENLDSAFRLLEEGYVRHDGEMMLLQVDPRFQVLRSDPRCADLLRRMGLSS